ncbi:MAG: hypothetical protein M3Y21_06885 [Candidatus Eremiobacteraeota bacterium]|nr:hypothetical protein [Candidatus Eremiobacteraeota bacterium]
MTNDPITRAAESWYGYGNWAAPYWFIGPEPGMRKDEGENLFARCEAWENLGHPEMLDCAAHHRMFAHMKYHVRTNRMAIPVGDRSMRPPTQAMWRRLIALLLAFKDERTDNDAIGDYQCAEWGSEKGETCVAELSALAANSLAVERDRAAFRRKRCEHLRMRLLQNTPVFAVMYGLRDQKSYETIVGAPFDSTGYAWAGNTLCALVEHPVARPGKPTEWWIEKGVAIRFILRMGNEHRLREPVSICEADGTMK